MNNHSKSLTDQLKKAWVPDPEDTSDEAFRQRFLKKYHPKHKRS
jgi:hypothetical protein